MKGEIFMKDKSQRSEADEMEKMIEALIRYYEGIEDLYERELKGKSEEVIRKMYKALFETDEDNTRVDEEEDER
jgi:hypothetical protein